MSDKYQKWIVFFILIFVFIDISAQSKSQAYINYINSYYKTAIIQQNEYNIPASIILAQGLLESGAGLSELSRKSNNHFGIKCHNWAGDKVYHDDDTRNECFRKYDKVLDSYEDHSLFLKNKSRYAFLFQLNSKDYEGWAHGLKQAGYATDPSYAYKLISIIENYDLHQFDIAVSNNENIVEKHKNQSVNIATQSNQIGLVDAYRIHTVFKNNRVKFVVSALGDTYASIADEMNIREKRLRAYNEVNEFAELSPGTQVYLRYKRRRAARGNSVHVVRTGESMFSIAHTYAVKVAKLYELNEMPYSQGASLGQVLKLR